MKRQAQGAQGESHNLTAFLQIPKGNGSVRSSRRQPIDSARGQEMTVRLKGQGEHRATIQGIGDEEAWFLFLNIPNPNRCTGGASGGQGQWTWANSQSRH